MARIPGVRPSEGGLKTKLILRRSRFNWALGVGAAGFSEGMVCAVPEPSNASVKAPLALRAS